MQKNVLFGLLGKLSSALAVVLLILSAVLVGASYLGLTENKLAGVATTIFAAVTAVFSLAVTNFSNFKLTRQIGDATEIAHHLSNGEVFDDFPEDDDELIFALKDADNHFVQAEKLSDQELHALREKLTKHMEAMSQELERRTSNRPRTSRRAHSGRALSRV